MFKQLVKSKKKKSGQRGGFNILDFQLRDESKGDVNPPAHTSNVPTASASVPSGNMEDWEDGIMLVFPFYSCSVFVNIVTYPIYYFLVLTTFTFLVHICLAQQRSGCPMFLLQEMRAAMTWYLSLKQQTLPLSHKSRRGT